MLLGVKDGVRVGVSVSVGGGKGVKVSVGIAVGTSDGVGGTSVGGISVGMGVGVGGSGVSGSCALTAVDTNKTLTINMNQKRR